MIVMLIDLPMGFFNWILENPTTFSQLLFSFALVISTIIYTWYTRVQTEEMEQTRETTNRPVVSGGLDIMGPTHLVSIIRNTGNGAAHNVSSNIYFEDVDAGPIEFKMPILPTGEEYEFEIPLDDDYDGFITGMDQVEKLINENDSEGILVIESEYEGPFGEEYETRSEVNIPDLRMNMPFIIRSSEEEKVRKALEGVESSLSDIEKKVNQEYQDEESFQFLYDLVRETIKEKGKIGFEDLKYDTGIQKSKTLHNIVNRMQKAGLVDYPSDENLRFHENVIIEWVGGSIEDVNEEEIGGASSRQIVDEIQPSVENGSENSDDEDVELQETED